MMDIVEIDIKLALKNFSSDEAIKDSVVSGCIDVISEKI